MHRRQFLNASAVGAGAFVLLDSQLANASPSDSPIGHVLPRSYRAPRGAEIEARLQRSVLELLERLHATQPLVVWPGLQRFSDIAFEQRIHYVIKRIYDGLDKGRAVYGLEVDPAIILALLYQESQFYECAVSPAGAYGIAQFTAPTARTMLARSLKQRELWTNERSLDELRLLAHPTIERVESARSALWQVKRPKQPEALPLELTVRLLEGGAATPTERQLVAAHTNYELELARYRDERDAAKASLNEALKDMREALFEGRSILDPADNALWKRTDARFSYVAIEWCVLLMLENLKRFDGGMLAALAAYNGGPQRAESRDPLLKSHGALPCDDSGCVTESVVYVVRVLEAAHQIRVGAES